MIDAYIAKTEKGVITNYVNVALKERRNWLYTSICSGITIINTQRIHEPRAAAESSECFSSKSESSRFVDKNIYQCISMDSNDRGASNRFLLREKNILR